MKKNKETGRKLYGIILSHQLILNVQQVFYLAIQNYRGKIYITLLRNPDNGL